MQMKSVASVFVSDSERDIGGSNSVEISFLLPHISFSFSGMLTSLGEGKL